MNGNEKKKIDEEKNVEKMFVAFHLSINRERRVNHYASRPCVYDAHRFRSIGLDWIPMT